MSGIDEKWKETETVLGWLDVFHTVANFWAFAPLHLTKQSAGLQNPKPVWI